MEAEFELQESYFDTNARLTDQTEKAFSQAGDERYTKFVALRAFTIEHQPTLEESLSEELMFEVRQDLILVLFCSSEAKVHHIDLVISYLKRHIDLSSSKYHALSEEEQAFVSEMMSLVVLGGGMASIKKNQSHAVWHSSTFLYHLGYDQPRSEDFSAVIIERIEKLLFPFYRLRQTTRKTRRPRWRESR